MVIYFGPQKWWLEQAITEGMVLHLDASNPTSYPGSGNTWYDLSGYGNHLTLYNGVSYDSGNGGVLNFNGTNQYAEVSANPSINVADITLFIFVYVRNTRGEEIILTRDSLGDNGYRLESLLYATMTSWGFVSSPSISYVPISGETLLQNNNWYCLAVTRNSVETKMYTNGQLLNTHVNTQNEVLQQSGDFRLAHGVGSAQRFLDGKIGLVQMYNRALSPQEITYIFNNYKNRFGL